MTVRDSATRFNTAALKIIEALGGDVTTGKCFCPVHDDGRNPSLKVNNGTKHPVVIHCFGGGRDHDREVIDKLRAMGVWPTSGHLAPSKTSIAAEQRRSKKDRLKYARGIWNGLKRSNGQHFAPLLKHYLSARAIKQVPSTALAALPIIYDDSEIGAHDPAMVLPIRNAEGKFKGIHVTWLNAEINGKRELNPQRQTYGLLKVNFVVLTKMDWDHPSPKLCVAEGVETALAMMQLTGLPGIAAAGQSFFQHLEPPRCAEYIIAPDNSDDGSSRKEAGLLAQRLVGSVVRIAMPNRPEGGKPGYDWNDALVDAGSDEDKLAELRRSILEAPRFEAVMTGVEKRELRISALAALKLDDHLAYEQERKTAAAELDLRVSVLDEEVDRRVGAMKETQQGAPPPPNMELLAASAKKIIESEDVLDLFVGDFSRLIAGEESLAKLIYLAATSRLFNGGAMHVAIKGPSAVGKSATRKAVLEFFPPEAVISFTAVSEKALLYFKDDFARKILSMGEASTKEETHFQDYLLRELMSEGKLRYMVPVKVGNEIETVTIEKNGPVAFIVTTTRNSLNLENETRMLSLEVDDSASQTRNVLRQVATVEGLNQQPVQADYEPWHDFQRWLAAGECRVIIPWAKTVTELIETTKSVRLRRDFRQLLLAIKAHAVVHRGHRKRNRRGEIVATIKEDYAPVYDLMKDLLASAAEVKARKTVVETVAAIVAVFEAAPRRDSVTVQQVAEKLGVDRSATYRRLQAAQAAGYVINTEKRQGYAGLYQVVEEPSAVSELLPSVEALQDQRDEELRKRDEERAERNARATPRNRQQRCTGGRN
jgi:hypothetical protein